MANHGSAAGFGPWSRRLLAVGVICAVVAALALVFVSRGAPRGHSVSSGSSGPATSFSQLTVGGPSARVAAGGLVMTLTLAPGPYFLSELVAEHLTLANTATRPYQLEGTSDVTACEQALATAISGGGAPTYTLPIEGALPCPFLMSTLAPGQMWTIDDFLPLTASGQITVTAGARFIVTATATDGTTYQTGSDGPFANRWPALHLAVAATIPASHTIVLHATTGHVTVQAPAGALSNLYDLEDAQCQQGQGTAEILRLTWQHIAGATLDEPACAGTHEVWRYSLAAPGYAIASGEMA